MAAAAAVCLVVVAAATAARPRSDSQAQIAAEIRAAFPDDPVTAECIASSESTGTHTQPFRFRAAAYNAGQYGLFQIFAYWHPTFDRSRGLVARYNIAFARRIYLNAKARWGNGWIPWTTRYGCGAG